jgi:hypothetical protein
VIHAYLAAITDRFDVRPVGEHAREVRRRATLRRLHPEFREPDSQPSEATA